MLSNYIKFVVGWTFVFEYCCSLYDDVLGATTSTTDWKPDCYWTIVVGSGKVFINMSEGENTPTETLRPLRHCAGLSYCDITAAQSHVRIR